MMQYQEVNVIVSHTFQGYFFGVLLMNSAVVTLKYYFESFIT